MRNLLRPLLFIMLVLVFVAACAGEFNETNSEAVPGETAVPVDQPEVETETETMADIAAMKTDVVSTYADMVYANYTVVPLMMKMGRKA